MDNMAPGIDLLDNLKIKLLHKEQITPKEALRTINTALNIILVARIKMWEVVEKEPG